MTYELIKWTLKSLIIIIILTISLNLTCTKQIEKWWKKVRKSKLLKPNNLLGCCMLCCLIAKPKTQLYDNGGSFVLEKKNVRSSSLKKKSLGGFSIEAIRHKKSRRFLAVGFVLMKRIFFDFCSAKFPGSLLGLMMNN